MATRLKATTVNDLSSKASAQLTVAAKDATIRIIYGRQQVWGQVYAVGFDAGALVVGVKWCMGGVWGIRRGQALYIDDEPPVAGVTYALPRHYVTDRVAGDASGAAGYADTLIYTTPTGINSDRSHGHPHSDVGDVRAAEAIPRDHQGAQVLRCANRAVGLHRIARVAAQ